MIPNSLVTHLQVHFLQTILMLFSSVFPDITSVCLVFGAGGAVGVGEKL